MPQSFEDSQASMLRTMLNRMPNGMLNEMLNGMLRTMRCHPWGRHLNLLISTNKR